MRPTQLRQLPGARTVEVLRLSEEDFQPAGRYESGQTLRTPLLEGLEIPVAKLFAG